jgi:hypothetical protein
VYHNVYQQRWQKIKCKLTHKHKNEFFIIKQNVSSGGLSADFIYCRCAQHAGPKWLFTSYFNESLEGFVFPEPVRNVCFVNYQHLLDNVIFTQNIKTLKLIGYNLPLNGNFQNIDLLVLDNCQTMRNLTTIPNIKNITICKGQLNSQIIADVQRYTFHDCQVINTIFKNTKNVHFNKCIVENVSFSSADMVCTDTDNLKQFHFSGPCNLHVYCPFEIIEFEI